MHKRTEQRIIAIALGATALAGTIALWAPQRTAQACGGLFCNAPPPDPFAPLPVAQTGENVVFAVDEDPAGGAPTLTAHIQIRYQGDADKFSWVVPVDAAPTLGVGTDQLFRSLGTLTQPQFTTTTAVDGTCLPDPITIGTGGSTGSGSGGSSGSGGRAGGAGGANGGVVVSFQGAVGPFDAAVISSTDAMALKTWLTTNGYTVTDQASGLIDDYVRDGKFFVALKLLNGVGVSSIQPITLTFKGTEPCVPLRLTAIAAFADMPIRLWILADSRAVPKNFYEMKIDDARIDWLTNGSNYNKLVSEAANEAGGNAFVAEYAGPSGIAKGLLWAEGRYNTAILESAMTPPQAVQALISLGLNTDTQALPLLAKYIPMPQALKDTGLTDAQFYSNISVYWGAYTFPPYDLVGLTADVKAKIIEPRHVAQLLIDTHSYMTRLTTFISPEEMNVDPLFILNKELPPVALVSTATWRIMCGDMAYTRCNAPVRLDLPSGRSAWVYSGSKSVTCDYRPYDTTGLASLPASEVAWQREDVGEGQVVVDNTNAITAGLTLNNARFLAAMPGGNPSPDGGVPTGSGGASGGTGGTGVGGAGVDGGTLPGTGGASGDGLGPQASGGDGCSCSLGAAGHDGEAAPRGLALLGLTLAGLFVARRRRRDSARSARP